MRLLFLKCKKCGVRSVLRKKEPKTYCYKCNKLLYDKSPSTIDWVLKDNFNKQAIGQNKVSSVGVKQER